MKPITLRTAMGSPTTECPAMNPSPEDGRSRVARKRIVVLLPAPLGPMKPKTSFLPIERLRSSTATNSPYRLVKFRTSIMDAPSPPDSHVAPAGRQGRPRPRLGPCGGDDLALGGGDARSIGPK